MVDRGRQAPGGRASTLHDVAREAGVSVMTASRALNGAPNVAAPTRERVRLAAETVGYRPSLAARALRSNQSRLIGLVASNLLLPVHVEVILGARDRALELDHELILQSDGRHGPASRFQSCDGHLVIGKIPPGSDYHHRNAVNLFGADDPGLDGVRTDLSRATYDAFSHLLATGCRRIGLIIMERPEVSAGRDRALAEYGLEPDPRLTRDFPPDNTGIEDAIGEWFELSDPPDALFVQNVAGTPRVLRELQRRGIAIGRDISFIGTQASRSDWGDLITPRMTTIVMPGYRIGAAGAERLIARLRGDDAPLRMIEFPAELLVRDSTPPR